MEAESDVSEPLQYMKCRWGDSISGTKHELQALGIGVGVTFPGEPGGPKRSMTVVDPRGFPTKVRFDWGRRKDRFTANVHFPGRETVYREVIRRKPLEYAPGVGLNQFPWWDQYLGTAAALIAAGLVKDGQFPGQPGMRKTRVQILADGTVPVGVPVHAGVEGRNLPGAKCVERASKTTFRVIVKLAEDEALKRRSDDRLADREWESRMDSLPRPPSLPLSADTVRPVAAQPHLSLVWSRP